jgi:hypothetical protein
VFARGQTGPSGSGRGVLADADDEIDKLFQ